MAAATLLWLSVHGCEQVDGGAVELSWKCRNRAGGFVACEETAVDRIRLRWTVDGESGSAAWDSAQNQAVTRFEVPVGTAVLTVEPECANGAADPASFEAPAPLVREVTSGDVVSLGAVVLVLQLDQCDAQPCVCDTP